MAASGTSAMKEVSHEGSMLVSVKTFLPVGVIKMWTLTPFGTSGAMDLGANIQAPEPMSYEYALSFSPDGKYLVAGTGVGTIDIWNPLKSELLRQIRHSKSPVFAVRVSPDGQKIASAGADGKIRIWSLESGDLLKEMGTGSTGSLRCVAYSPDGHYLASGGDDNNIYLWNVDSAKTELTMRGKICGINSIAFSPDGKYLATGSMDMTVKLWSVPSGDLVSTQIGHLGNVNSVTFSPDGRKLASGGHDKMIRLWDIPSGTQTTKFSEMGAVNSLSFYSDGQFLASAISGELTTGWGGLFKDEFQKKVVGITLKVWSVEAIKVNESWEEGSAHAVSYSPNSKYLAFGVAGKKLHPYIEDSYVLVFDLRQQLKASKLGGFGLKVCSVAFSQNEQYLGAASADGMVKIWETTKWKEKKKLTAHKSQINSIVFSPDGKYFVTGGQDGLVKFWQTESAKLERQIDFHDGPVKSVAFSPDGRYLASGSMDGSVCFWDTETGNMTMRLVAFILNQYVAYTNENYFRCSPLAEEFIHFKVGDDIYKLSDYKQKFGWQNQPEKVALK
jgi:WD40 repeat protein